MPSNENKKTPLPKGGNGVHSGEGQRSPINRRRSRPGARRGLFSSALRIRNNTKFKQFSNPLMLVWFSRNMAKTKINLIYIYSSLFELFLSQF